MPDHSQQPIVSDLNAPPLSEYEKQIAQAEMNSERDRARLTNRLSHNETLDQKPTTEEFAPASPETSTNPADKTRPSNNQQQSTGTSSEYQQQNLSEKERAEQYSAQEEERQQNNLRSDRLNAITPMRMAGSGLSLINRKRIQELQQKRKQKFQERTTVAKEIKKIKRKLFRQKIRIIIESISGIGLGGALIETMGYKEKKDILKKNNRMMTELDAEIKKLETQEYNLTNVFQKQIQESPPEQNGS